MCKRAQIDGNYFSRYLCPFSKQVNYEVGQARTARNKPFLFNNLLAKSDSMRSQGDHHVTGVLQGLHVRTMAICALLKHLLIGNDRFVFIGYLLIVDNQHLNVTFVTGDICVPTLQGEVRTGIVVEDRGYPALGIVTLLAGCLSRLDELPVMSIFVTIGANL